MAKFTRRFIVMIALCALSVVLSTWLGHHLRTQYGYSLNQSLLVTMPVAAVLGIISNIIAWRS